MINLKNINKSFYSKKKEQKIFNNASVSFDNVGLTAIVAPSGTGKTTLFNMICCLDKKYEGTIELDGNLVTDELVKKNISYLMQEDNLFNNLSVLDNLMIYDEVEEKDIDNLLKEFDIIDLKDKNVSKLSGGQRRRVALVRALIKKPKVLICDEPTSSLDKSNSIVVMDILKKISRDILVIYSSHDDELVDEYSDSVYLLSNNNIICKKSINNSKEILFINNDYTISKNYKKNIIKHLSFGNRKIIFNSLLTIIIFFIVLLFCFSIFKNDIIKVQIDTMKHENDTSVMVDKGSDYSYAYSIVNTQPIDINLPIENWIYDDYRDHAYYYIPPIYHKFIVYDDNINYGTFIGSAPKNTNEIMIYQLTAEILLHYGILQNNGERLFYDNIEKLIGKELVFGNDKLMVTGIIKQDLELYQPLKKDFEWSMGISKKYRKLELLFLGKIVECGNKIITTSDTVNSLNQSYLLYDLNSVHNWDYIELDDYNEIKKELSNYYVEYDMFYLIANGSYDVVFGTHYSYALCDYESMILIIRGFIKYCIPIIIIIVLLISYLLTRNILEKNSKNIALMKMTGFSKKDIIFSFSVSMIIYYLLSFVISSGLFIIVTRLLCSYFTKLYYFYFDPFYLEISYFIYLLIAFVVLSLISYFMINRFYNKMNAIKLTRNN